MRKILFTILFALLFVFPCYATTTFVWEHDCSEPDIIGFRLYYEGIEIANVNCPDTSLTFDENLPEGYYTVKAYDTESLESLPSNEVLLAAYYYNSIRYEYNSQGQLLYKGQHTDHDASVSDTNWVISKYYYSKGAIIQIRIRTTSWINRAQGW